MKVLKNLFENIGIAKDISAFFHEGFLIDPVFVITGGFIRYLVTALNGDIFDLLCVPHKPEIPVQGFVWNPQFGNIK